jgi:phosphoheptose isomerase
MIHEAQRTLVRRYPELEGCMGALEQAFTLLEGCYRGGGKVLVCGNGGSAADSEHIVGELMKGFLSRRPLDPSARQWLIDAFPEDGMYLADNLQGALPALSLVSQTALLSAYANDVAPDMIFAQQVYGYGRPGDALIGISTSGNSGNVLRALQVARAMGLATIGLTGRSGGRMVGLCDVTLQVPYDTVTEIQERHLPIYHTLCIMLEEAFFPPGGSS